MAVALRGFVILIVCAGCCFVDCMIAFAVVVFVYSLYGASWVWVVDGLWFWVD